jgi:hypothetical protein
MPHFKIPLNPPEAVKKISYSGDRGYGFHLLDGQLNFNHEQLRVQPLFLDWKKPRNNIEMRASESGNYLRFAGKAF